MTEPAPTSSAVTIGIAVVRVGDDVLVGRRREDQDLPGLAEFPGGKCLPGESPRSCAERECREETTMTVEARELLLRKTHRYQHATVDLHFWLCAPANAEEQATDGFRWIPLDQLAELDFPKANRELIRLLTHGDSANDRPASDE